MCKLYFHQGGRLQNSYLTIENEIPFRKLAGTEYFKKFMETLLKLPQTFGERLTIKLDPASTEKLMDAQEEVFYPTKVDLKELWRTGPRAIVAEKNLAHWVRFMVNKDYKGDFVNVQFVDPDMVNHSKQQFCQKQKDLRMDKEIAVGQALSNTQAFIRAVRNFERSKDPALAVLPWKSPEWDHPAANVVADQRNGMNDDSPQT